MPQHKKCQVCGDEAIGHNFNVLSCKSCKAFFRRTVVKNKLYKCLLKSDCKINVVTRKHCQKCRYEKCLTRGMVKGNIGSMAKKPIEMIGNEIRNNVDNESEPVPDAINLQYETMKSAPTNPLQPLHNFKIKPQVSVRPIPQQPVSMTLTEPDWMQSTSTKPNSNPRLQSGASSMSQEPFSNESSTIQSTSTDGIQILQNINTIPQSNVSDMSPESFPIASNEINTVQSTSTDGIQILQNINTIPQSNVSDMSLESLPIASNEINTIQSTSTNGMQILQNINTKPPASASDMSLESFSIASYEINTIQSTSTNGMQILQNINTKPPDSASDMSLESFSIVSNEPCHIPTPLTLNQIFGNTPTSVDNEEMHRDLNCPNSSSSQDLLNCLSTIEVRRPHNIFPVKYFSNVDKKNYAPSCNEVEKESHEKECGNGFSISSDARIITNRMLESNSIQEMLNIAVSADYSDLANRSGFSCFGSNRLTPIEVQKLNELICAYPYPEYVLNFSEDDRIFFRKKPNQLLPNIIDAMDIGVRRMIKFSKRITAFKNLCEEDQIALLKGSFKEVLNLSWALTYNSKICGWEFPDAVSVKIDEIKEIKGNIYEEYKQFVQSFDSTWKSEEAIFFIILTIILFTPTRPNILHPKSIANELYSYYFLLLRYLESRYSSFDAKLQFMRIIRTVQEIKQLNENHFKVFFDANPKYVAPLLTEIFDL